jgi:6-pyruvoyltetrahydropterin/6-carboxytetrahydropterin synthase
MARTTLKVRHNIEVAHRLVELPGKCQQIHGHSMWVVVEFYGEVNEHGILLGMDFADVKRRFRAYVDKMYDHRLLLNENDGLLVELRTNDYEAYYPGVNCCPGDPTTENIARWIGQWCVAEFGTVGLYRMRCEVWETQVNSATWEAELEPARNGG